MSTHPDLERLRRAHPGWRISYDAGVWYARGPGLEGNTVRATSPEQLDAELTNWRQR